ncbi:ATP-binding cassette domain-containing protein [Thioclava nitratireducens]|uniref:ATP-binding cassette domain-containing protein n=1 Tax=Thioclava nitratireducens TaxID=1915078 RepID=UPI00247FFB2A|nr:ATP-binding cassette domain-containing protein [Thioclava nitratireducens]WGT52192.1 ATP-binding cassette domain-containing protein [Thioclava nitratireducens]
MSLELIDLSLTAPGASAPLFASLSLVVAPGETVCLMGPSGIGKSSLLAHIGGHLSRGFTASGDVLLDGESVTQLPAEKRGIGMLFQQAQLFPHLSVGDNLAFGLPGQVKGKAARRAAVEVALEQAGLAGMADRDPATLSGGQSTRAALMRTLLARPRAVLIDEPFAALDAELRAEIRSFTLQHLAAERIPCLMVSHDPEDGAAAARRITLG